MTNLTFLVVLAYLLMSPAYAQNALREYLHQDKLSEAGIKQAISVNESPQDATTRAARSPMQGGATAIASRCSELHSCSCAGTISRAASVVVDFAH